MKTAVTRDLAQIRVQIEEFLKNAREPALLEPGEELLPLSGEGGISPYHRNGGDLIYQLGTGYFGSRDEKGRFSLSLLKALLAEVPSVRALEIKLSQGAK